MSADMGDQRSRGSRGNDSGKVLHYHYNHFGLKYRRRVLRFLIKTIGFGLLAKIDQVDGIDNVPDQGPAILMINHIALIDPIVVLHVLRRNIIPLAKVEVYDYPLIGILPKLWGVIPVRREEIDRRAVHQVMEVLNAGEIVLVAPEGTRSPQLRPARQGVAYLASRSHVPVIPVAITGTTGFPALPNSERWKQPGAHVTFGRPFRFRRMEDNATELVGNNGNAESRNKSLTEVGAKSSNDAKDMQGANPHSRRDDLRKMTDEAMFILAALLPPGQRGVYSDLSQASQDTIMWV
jgi:1-acyl-sn-glycerol-3-phosphate acyltransferase